MEFRYEMHQHTSLCSACGGDEPEPIIESLHSAGFQGTVITEHFYHGNTRIDRNLTWEEFCSAYEECYIRAKKAAEKYDMDVLFGFEEAIPEYWQEVLVYGITPDMLYGHPELRDGSLEVLSQVVRSSGGLLIQAHPFRGDLALPVLPPEYLDGYEVWNACTYKERNEMAMIYSAPMIKISTAGSDSHNDRPKHRSYIVTGERIRTESELVSVLRARKYRLEI